MSRKEHKALVAKLGKDVVIIDWLKTLPLYHVHDEAVGAIELKQAIPIIQFPSHTRPQLVKKLRKLKRKLVWSTVNYCYTPIGYDTSAIGFITRSKPV